MPIKQLETVEQFESIKKSLILKNDFRCVPKSFSSSEQWGVFNGEIRRNDRNFFSILGLKAYSNKNFVPLLEQPIIFQPTNAINGFLLKGTKQNKSILFQARIEPGNTGVVQLAPTVQSTEANYKQLHGGRPTSFIQQFLFSKQKNILYKELQSEEGSRYHGKYNLNLIVQADENDFLEEKEDFLLLAPEQIKNFICTNHVINTDARALLFFLDWELLCENSKAFDSKTNPVNQALMKSYYYTGSDIGTDILVAIKKLMQTRATFAVSTNHTSLHDLKNWELSDTCLKEKEEQLGYNVSLYEVHAQHREVGKWDQPLISSNTVGRVILFCRINKGIMEFLISVDREIGYLEGAQFTASASIAPGKRAELFLQDEFSLLEIANNTDREDIILECQQSEEGGRFFNDINHYQIILTEKEFNLSNSSGFLWMTLSQIKKLGNFPSFIAIELRCVLTLLINLL